MIRLSASLTKKIPHPTLQYGSIGASLSLDIECVPGQDPVQESQRLFGQLDQAVEAELQRQTAGAGAPEQAPEPSSSTRAADESGRDAPPNAAAPSRSGSPYPSSGSRRPPAAISAAQLRFLRQLCDRTRGAQERIFTEHKVGALEQLTSRAASGIIDQLKGVAR